ncbi:zinc ribbon domain-containing protein [Natranaerovirga pectinivora]|uniref:zinc ribbon domain-containing protein n=1 Tax=Natranaerovirga pectinivora TaxID=682400 RepID=UPI001042F1AD|nr:zinc ribbon domain-containing protein [Natranaerovirga pectinivora]
MECPKCNEKLSMNSRNCKYCGEFIAKTNTEYKYQSDEKFEVKNTSARLDGSIKICYDCGEVNKKTDYRCYNCNSNLEETYKRYMNEVKEKTKREEQRKHIFIKFVVISQIILYLASLILSTIKPSNEIPFEIIFITMIIATVISGLGIVAMLYPDMLILAKSSRRWYLREMLIPTEDAMKREVFSGVLMGSLCVGYSFFVFISLLMMSFR